VTGAGYGDPLTREPEPVADDVKGGKVSTDRTASLYGVVLTKKGKVDAAATKALRQRKGAGRFRAAGSEIYKTEFRARAD
jgi:N-methylhydantoinase B/oxoprolinase/acetone carboxylase alpha subunit